MSNELGSIESREQDLLGLEVAGVENVCRKKDFHAQAGASSEVVHHGKATIATAQND